MDLVRKKKEAALAEKTGSISEKGSLQGRDLLSLLIKVNMDADTHGKM